MAKLAGDVTKTIERAKELIKDMPHAKNNLGPLLEMFGEPLFQILGAVGMLLNGVLSLVVNIVCSSSYFEHFHNHKMLIGVVAGRIGSWRYCQRPYQRSWCWEAAQGYWSWEVVGEKIGAYLILVSCLLLVMPIHADTNLCRPAFLL